MSFALHPTTYRIPFLWIPGFSKSPKSRTWDCLFVKIHQAKPVNRKAQMYVFTPSYVPSQITDPDLRLGYHESTPWYCWLWGKDWKNQLNDALLWVGAFSLYVVNNLSSITLILLFQFSHFLCLQLFLIDFISYWKWPDMHFELTSLP